MTTWRTRLTLMGLMVILIALLPLSLNSPRAKASPLAQPPPTYTPTAVPVPTDTPIPPTPIPPTPIPTTEPAPTVTPIPPVTPPTPSAPALTPIPKKSGGGGGAPAGPSGTPVSNGCVKSIGKDGVSLSTEPGFYKPHVQIAPVGDILWVVQGPVRADNIQWWLLRTATGIEGWGNQDNITPDPGPCVAGKAAGTLADKTLPQTGRGVEGQFFLALALAAVVIAVGIVRRRLQTPAITTGSERGRDGTASKN
jgi:hypothetical protein